VTDCLCSGVQPRFQSWGVQFLGLGYCTEQNTDGIPSFVDCSLLRNGNHTLHQKSWGGPSKFWGSRPPNLPSGCTLAYVHPRNFYLNACHHPVSKCIYFSKACRCTIGSVAIRNFMMTAWAPKLFTQKTLTLRCGPALLCQLLFRESWHSIAGWLLDKPFTITSFSLATPSASMRSGGIYVVYIPQWFILQHTAKQVAMVWACAAKRRHWLGEEMYGKWRAPDQEVDQRGHGQRLCKKIVKHAIWTGRMRWIVVEGRW